MAVLGPPSPTARKADLLDDPEPNIGSCTGFKYPDFFERNPRNINMLKQAQTTTEQNRHDPHMEFITKPRMKALLIDAGANQNDVFVSGGGFGLGYRALNPIGHEGKGQRFTLFGLFLWNMMGKHKDRHLILIVVGK